MRNARLALFGLVALFGAATLAAPDAGPQEGPTARLAPAPRVVRIDIDGPITGATAEYVASGYARARNENAAALLIVMDTPGGALDATHDIVKDELGSEIPTLVWVGPAGARAGSAGVFLTLAANVAAMHPSSNIGAAHPVTSGGGDVEKEAGKDMARKIENDTAAWARSIAKTRGRSEEFAEKAVRESESITAAEAVAQKAVDFTAPTVESVLAQADGRQLETAGGWRTLHTQAATVEPLGMTIRQRTLAVFSDPNVAALLMLVGMLGVGLEFYHPGGIWPGALGAFCLLLAFLAMRVIPVNVGAVLLLLAGVGLMISEAYVTTHGIAGAAGAGCMLLGTLLFIDKSSPDYVFDPAAFQLSPLVVWPTPIALAGIMGFVAWNVIRSRRAPLAAGAPGLVGELGEALSEIGPQGGEAFVHGEYWKARAAAPIARGTRIRVVAVDGLVVTVAAA